jgi:hypothetical protein
MRPAARSWCVAEVGLVLITESAATQAKPETRAHLMCVRLLDDMRTNQWGRDAALFCA